MTRQERGAKGWDKLSPCEVHWSSFNIIIKILQQKNNKKEIRCGAG